MTQAQWFFSPLGNNAMRHDVTEGDQFNTETVQRTEALVREATQNTQDARSRVKDGPVRLRISLVTEENGLDAKYLSDLVSGLKPHLEASGFSISDNNEQSPSALLVEDFGTMGLTGETEGEFDEDKPGHYRSFFFTHGHSAKHGNKNGRWGLGKLVYPMTSAARCFFGLTVRENDPRPLLLGQTVLKTHRVDGQRFAPHGHFGLKAGGMNDLKPVTSSDEIEKFRNAFGLSRKNEPGLSVVVPYPTSNTECDQLLEFVVQNYAYPILTNRLVIDVLGEVVDADSVRMIGKKVLPAGLIEFIDSVHDMKPEQFVKVAPRGLGVTDRITEDLIDGDVEELRQRYVDGELLGFQVPVKLKRKDEREHQSEITVFFQSAKENEEGTSLCVRGDITVPDEAKKFNHHGSFAMMLARQEEVSEFLADAENPAHTLWLGTAERLRTNWRYPGQTLTQVRGTPVTLHKLLTTGKEHVDSDALKSFFWIEDPDAPPDKQPGRKSKKKPDEDDKPDFPPLPPSKKRLVLQKRKGGFTIQPGADFAELPLPVGVKVTVRYAVEFGKPQWDSFDFDFGNEELSIEHTGGEVDADENVIHMSVEEPLFSLAVTGFDTNRDLVVDYSLIKQREPVDA